MASPFKFTFGGEGDWSYDELQRRRKIAEKLAEGASAPRNVGEGLTAIGKALLYRGMTKRADQEDARMRGEFSDTWASLFGGGASGASGGGYSPSPAASGGYSAPKTEGQAVASDAMAALGYANDGFPSALPASLVQSESGGRFSAKNDVPGSGGVGHFGRGQFSIGRLEDAKRAGVIPASMTPDQFLADPGAQAKVEQWHVGDINGFIRRNGLDQFVGQKIGGVTVTPEGMLAVAHLGGSEGLRKFLQTGGAYNPADAYGTSLMDYLAKHGAAAGAQPLGTASPGATAQPIGTAQPGMSATPAQGNLQAWAEVMSSPYASPGQRAIAQAMIGRIMDPPKPEARKTQWIDGMGLMDMQSGQIISAAPEAGPEYSILTPEQEAELGLNPEGTYQRDAKGKILPIGSPSTNVTVNTGDVGGVPVDEEKLREKLGGAEGDLWAGLLTQGNKASGSLADLQLLEEIATMAPQGPVTGRLAGAFPGVNSAADAFQSIVKRVAPTLRAEGSGSTSDIEYAGMLAALPQLAARPEANAAIIAMMRAKAQIDMERADIIAQYQNEEISAKEARNAIREINSRSIVTPELQGVLGALAPAPAAPSDGGGQFGVGDPATWPAPEGIDPEDWKYLDPEMRKLWVN